MFQYDFETFRTVDKITAERLIPALIAASMLFAIMPVPDDKYRVMCRKDNEPRLNAMVDALKAPVATFADDVLTNAQNRYAWTDRTKLSVAAAFIDQQHLADRFAEFVTANDAVVQE